MAQDFEIRGVEDFKVLSVKLKNADKPLRLRFARELRAGLKPTVTAIKESASRELPRRGGLAALVANTPIRTAVTNNSAGIEVRIRHSGKPPVRDLKSIDAGKLRHPVFGTSSRRVAGSRRDSVKADAWVSQAIKPGYFTDPAEKAKPAAVAAAQRALDGLAKELD